MLQTGRRAIRVAGVAAAVLVMTAGVAAAANRGTGTALPARQHTSRTVKYTETYTCAIISQNGPMVVEACAGHNSVDGDLARVATSTLNGTTGTDTAIDYRINGVSRANETFTIGARDANGMTPYTETGTCTGGTGVHKHEKCSYTITGTLNQTLVDRGTITGTTTR
jgi:hypothetical protein